MSKHTAGPWTLEFNEIDLVRVKGPKHGVCLTDNANAHLIGAAPEMLECLEAILDAYNYGEQQPLWEEIEALVKKVKGCK